MRKRSVALAYLFVLVGTAAVQAQPGQAQDTQDRDGSARQRANSMSAEPPPKPGFDDVTEVPSGIPQDQANLNAMGLPEREFRAADDWVKWLIGGVALFVVWMVIKALGRGAKKVSKVAIGAAIDVAPSARQVANRVGSTAAQRTKGFFAETRKCPNCAELIKKEAKVCRFCQRPVL